MKRCKGRSFLDKYRALFLAIGILLSFFVSQAQTYNPSLHTVTNKAIGISQATPVDARSMFYDQSNFVYRDYQNVNEVWSYLNLPKYRAGGFPVYVHSGGILNGNGTYTGGLRLVYWFKDSTGNANLVRWYTDSSTSACPGCLLAALNLGDLSNANTARANLGLGAMAVLGTTAGGDLSGSFPNPTVSRFNGQLPSFYTNYLNLFNTPVIPAQLNPTGVGLLSITGTYPNLTFNARTPGFEETLFQSNATSRTDSINIGSFIFRMYGTSAFGLPTGTTAQRPGSPAAGDTRWNTDSLKKETYNGSAWITDGTGGGGGSGITALTGDGTASGTGSVPFTLATVNSNVFGSNTFLKFGVNGKGLVTSATAVVNSDIVTALGFTPYNATNPNGYIPLTALSASAPLSYNSGTGAFSIQVANTSQNGYLSSTDWNTFNGKQAAGNYITGLTGDVVATGPGSVSSLIQANAITTTKILNNAVTLGKMATGTPNYLIGYDGSGNAVALAPDTLFVKKQGTPGDSLFRLSNDTLYTPAIRDSLAFHHVVNPDGSWTMYATGAGSGTVTSFSAGNLSPLFTTSVATSTTTPALTFSLSNAAANTAFGNFTGSSAAPAFGKVPLAAWATGTANTLTGYDASGNPSGITAGTNITISAGVISATGSAGGITSLNGLTGATQTFALATNSTPYAVPTITSSGTVHTFNRPTYYDYGINSITGTTNNLFYGSLVGNQTATGIQNTGMGISLMGNLTTGQFNTAFGNQAGKFITKGTGNSFFGWLAGTLCDSCLQETAIGGGALSGDTAGFHNTAVGYGAGDFMSFGSDNVLLGNVVAQVARFSSQNVMIGSKVGAQVDGDSLCILMGYANNQTNHLPSKELISIGSNSQDVFNTAYTKCILIGDGLGVGTNLATLKNTTAIGHGLLPTLDSIAMFGNKNQYVKLTDAGGTTAKMLSFVNAPTGSIYFNTDSTTFPKSGYCIKTGSGAWLTLYAGPSAVGTPSTALSSITAATAANTIDNVNFAQEWQWNSLAAGNGLFLTSNSTAAASNTQKLLALQMTGANATSAQTTTALDVQNLKTGTTAINVAGHFKATGAPTNYPLITEGGNVGIGTLTPTVNLHVLGTGSSVIYAEENLSGGFSEISGRTHNGTGQFELYSLPSTYAGTTGGFSAASSYMRGTGTSGLCFSAQNATGVLRYFTGGEGFAQERLRVDSIGRIHIDTVTGLSTFNIGGSRADNHPGLRGYQFTSEKTTFTDNSTANSGTVAMTAANSLMGGNISAFHTSVTYTNAATLYIDSALKSANNATIGTGWAEYINQGGLYVGGVIQIKDGSQANGNVLVSDANGLASWQNTNSTKFTQAADNTLTNSAANTTIVGTGVGSNTLSANTITVGKTIRIAGIAYLSTDAVAPSLTFTFANSSSSSTLTMPTLGTLLNNSPLEWEATMTCRSTGSSGTVSLNGWVSISGTKTYFAITSPSLFNTTIGQTIDLQAQFGTASTNNTIITKTHRLTVN